MEISAESDVTGEFFARANVRETERFITTFKLPG
jgi:hypothetical protein